MRSSSGGGTVSSMFAVQMNSTFDQIERHVQIVVAERVVLLRIQRLQQRRCRIAAEVASQLVDLVQHDHRVVGFRPPNALDDLPRQRADVRPPMSANLRLVVHAAQRDALELPPQRPRNRPAQARFAHARRPDKAQESAPSCPASAPARSGNPECGPSPSSARSGPRPESPSPCRCRSSRRALGPRQHRQPLDVVARQRVVRRHRRHPRQPRQLLQRLLLHVLRHARGFNLLPQLVDVALASSCSPSSFWIAFICSRR